MGPPAASLPRAMLSAQKYLFKIILENSKQTRKISKTQYVTTDDVY
jgi:hypothetical protein